MECDEQGRCKLFHLKKIYSKLNWTQFNSCCADIIQMANGNNIKLWKKWELNCTCVWMILFSLLFWVCIRSKGSHCKYLTLTRLTKEQTRWIMTTAHNNGCRDSMHSNAYKFWIRIHKKERKQWLAAITTLYIPFNERIAKAKQIKPQTTHYAHNTTLANKLKKADKMMTAAFFLHNWVLALSMRLSLRLSFRLRIHYNSNFICVCVWVQLAICALVFSHSIDIIVCLYAIVHVHCHFFPFVFRIAINWSRLELQLKMAR